MVLKNILNFVQRKKQLAASDVAETDLFFFYGSLMERYENFNRFIKRKVTRLNVGYCRGYLYYLPMGFPGLIYPEDACSSLVAGEIMTFSNPARTLRLLDRLEQYNPLKPHKSIYVRKKLPVIIEEQEENGVELKQVHAWVYTYPEDHLSKKHQRQVRIECGQWTAFRTNGQPQEELRHMASRLSYCDLTQQIMVDPILSTEPPLRESQHLYGCQRFCEAHDQCKRAFNTANVDSPAVIVLADLPCTD